MDYRRPEVKYGGGIALAGNCRARISNCFIVDNKANKHGGGIIIRSKTPTMARSTITNCTIANNRPDYYYYYHYEVDCWDTQPVISNTIIWNDNSRRQRGLFIANPSLVTYSCVRDVHICEGYYDEYVEPYDITAVGGNISKGPRFVQPVEPRTENMEEVDYHLLGVSPCIDAGNPAFTGGSEMDIDGQPRVMAGRIDIGADEVVPKIIVNKPAGGEVWTSGSIHEINWASYGAGAVDILFSKNGGGDWQPIESSISDTGSYIWHLPNSVYSEQCLISVVPSVPDANVVCVESGVFTLQRYPRRPDVPLWWKFFKRKLNWWLKRKRPGPELGCVKWQFETDGPVTASAAPRLSNRVHIACEDGKLYTLKKNDGTLLWSYDTNSPLISSPTAGYYGMVYVGSEDGKLHAIDWHGRLLWTHTTDGFIYSSPVASPDGKVYVCSQDGTLYSLAPDGSELWSFKTGGLGTSSGSILASPAIGADDTVYIGGFYDPNLYALDPNDGSLKWTCNFEYEIPCDDHPGPECGIRTGWPFASPVVAEDGTIYQTLLFDPNLYAIEPNTGTIIWSTRLTAHCDFLDEYWHWAWGIPPPDWLETFEEFCDDWFGIALKDWVKYRYANCWSEPALGTDGTIYVSFDDPYLRAVDPNGSIRWVTRLGMMGGFTLTIGSDGLIYAASDDAHLYVVNPDGEEIARFQGNDWLSFPVIARDNTIIVSDANNTVWAIGGDGCETADLHRPEDLSTDWAVNFIDFALLAADWHRLNCMDADAFLFPCEWHEWPCCEYPSDGVYFTGDIDRNLYVDFADLTALANRWLSEE